MSTVREAVDELESALKDADMRVYRDPGANVQPPSVMLTPGELRWEAFDYEPTLVRMQVYVIEKADGRQAERLWESVPDVARTIERSVRDAVVTPSAQPGTFNAGSTELPCYELTVEVAL